MTIQFLDDELPVENPQPVVAQPVSPQPVAPIPQPVASVVQSLQPMQASWFSRRSFVVGFAAACLLFFGWAYIKDRRFIDDDRGDAVVTDKGFRVMMIYEATKVGSYAEGQQSTLTSVPVRQWLDANCAKDGENNGYFIGDVDTPLDKLSQALQAMRQQAKPPYPCVIISNPPKSLVVEELRRDIEPSRFIQLLEDRK